MTRVVELLNKSTLFDPDSLFGSVVETIRDHGLFDDAAIVFTADHGEVLYRKNARFQWSHGFQLAPRSCTFHSSSTPRVWRRACMNR